MKKFVLLFLLFFKAVIAADIAEQEKIDSSIFLTSLYSKIEDLNSPCFKELDNRIRVTPQAEITLAFNKNLYATIKALLDEQLENLLQNRSLDLPKLNNQIDAIDLSSMALITRHDHRKIIELILSSFQDFLRTGLNSLDKPKKERLLMIERLNYIKQSGSIKKNILLVHKSDGIDRIKVSWLMHDLRRLGVNVYVADGNVEESFFDLDIKQFDLIIVLDSTKLSSERYTESLFKIFLSQIRHLISQDILSLPLEVKNDLLFCYYSIGRQNLENLRGYFSLLKELLLRLNSENKSFKNAIKKINSLVSEVSPQNDQNDLSSIFPIYLTDKNYITRFNEGFIPSPPETKIASVVKPTVPNAVSMPIPTCIQPIAIVSVPKNHPPQAKPKPLTTNVTKKPEPIIISPLPTSTDEVKKEQPIPVYSLIKPKTAPPIQAERSKQTSHFAFSTTPIISQQKKSLSYSKQFKNLLILIEHASIMSENENDKLILYELRLNAFNQLWEIIAELKEHGDDYMAQISLENGISVISEIINSQIYNKWPFLRTWNSEQFHEIIQAFNNRREELLKKLSLYQKENHSTTLYLAMDNESEFTMHKFYVTQLASLLIKAGFIVYGEFNNHELNPSALHDHIDVESKKCNFLLVLSFIHHAKLKNVPYEFARSRFRINSERKLDDTQHTFFCLKMSQDTQGLPEVGEARTFDMSSLHAIHDQVLSLIDKMGLIIENQ